MPALSKHMVQTWRYVYSRRTKARRSQHWGVDPQETRGLSGQDIYIYTGRNARVDVAELFKGEEVGAMLRIVEDVGGGGVDRDRAGVGGGIHHLKREGGMKKM